MGQLKSESFPASAESAAQTLSVKKLIVSRTVSKMARAESKDDRKDTFKPFLLIMFFLLKIIGQGSSQA
jgi:hypothetical protein